MSQSHKKQSSKNAACGAINLAVEFDGFLDKAGEKPLFVQLYSEICRLILCQRLRGGSRLPSSRAMAADLGLSRTTVLSAYEQLEAEGYIEARRGAGVFVVEGLGDGVFGGIESTNTSVSAVAHNKFTTSKRSSNLMDIKPRRSAITAFDAGKPDLELFPFDQWARLLAKSWRHPSIAQLYEGENGGFAPLKKQISYYLQSARGLACSPEQVILTSSTHAAIEVLSEVLLDEGEEVWVEDPAYHSALQAFVRAGVKPVPVRVDDEGFSLNQALAKTTKARLVFITPSRQYPLGQTMSLSRRLALIEWARSNNSWLVEDDYDSEYRYRGQPLAPLAARDGFERTIYLGSFSKVMFPSLRLSYMVAPLALVKPLLAILQSSGKQASIVAQPALADFMATGHFAQHIRRTRRLYAKRHTVLVEALEIHGGDLFEVQHYDSGMHVVARFKPVLTATISDIEAALYLRQHNLISTALSQTFQTLPKSQGLLLGFAAVPEKEIAAKVEKLADLLRQRIR